MDKSWMGMSRISKEYANGVECFLDFAFRNTPTNGLITCPCRRCRNIICHNRLNVKEHLIVYGFLPGYRSWIAHGEYSSSSIPVHGSSASKASVEMDTVDDMKGMLHDLVRNYNEGHVMGGEREGDEQLLNPEEPNIEAPTLEGPNPEARRFYSLVEDAQKALYPNCVKFTKLSFIVRLLHIKCLGNWSNKSFDMLLDLLTEAFPDGTILPKSYYETKKVMKELGLGYNKINACCNDCMLFWGNDAEKNTCDICGTSRWVERSGATSDSKTDKRVAAKTFWHFPLIPRLQRLFMSSKTASSMQWHINRPKDGYMRHPADSPAWQTHDYLNPDFGKEPRNVRLGLACDGFNPFKNMNVSHSTWPVVMTCYNLPPWMCTKQQYLMLSLLIPGPHAPGNNLDVYLQPLISELKELWEVGVDTYDAATKQNFRMRAALLWTVSDFPGYANLSGWSTKGKLACPVCQKETSSRWLTHGGKWCYMGHRRFLVKNHPFRKDSQSFDGTEEHRGPPTRMTGSMVLEELKGYDIKFGKLVKDNPELPYRWKKKSIFFQLSYWKDNLLPHNLDVMHIEKNVLESVIHTLMNEVGKSKDNDKARQDLKEWGIREELHPLKDDSENSRYVPACFSLNKKEKATFCRVLKGLKVPDGYSSNISRSVQLKPARILGLKSHDCHVLMQQLLPLALRKLLPDSVRKPLFQLCTYFREVCSKVLNPIDLVQLESEIPLTLCQLEMIFPPAFFDVMVHLTIHIASEARLAGPVQYRWMYFKERFLNTLGKYVRNRRRPEGSIAEGYLAEESINFCSMYLADDVPTKFNQLSRNEGIIGSNKHGLDIFSLFGRPMGKAESKIFDKDTLTLAHRYVLFNCKEVEPYIEAHFHIIREQNSHLRKHKLEEIHSSTFAEWFRGHVDHLSLNVDDPSIKDLLALARGPRDVGIKYKRYVVNGFRFHTEEIAMKTKTQNSGVVITATTSSFSNTKDDYPISSDITYYGVLKDIIELHYDEGNKVVLFDCDWVSTGSRVKQDDDGFTVVNLTNVKRHKEPFVLATQVRQVFYVQDPFHEDWRIVMTTTPRDKFDMDEKMPLDHFDAFMERVKEPNAHQNERISWVREE